MSAHLFTLSLFSTSVRAFIFINSLFLPYFGLFVTFKNCKDNNEVSVLYGFLLENLRL